MQWMKTWRAGADRHEPIMPRYVPFGSWQTHINIMMSHCDQVKIYCVLYWYRIRRLQKISALDDCENLRWFEGSALWPESFIQDMCTSCVITENSNFVEYISSLGIYGASLMLSNLKSAYNSQFGSKLIAMTNALYLLKLACLKLGWIKLKCQLLLVSDSIVKLISLSISSSVRIFCKFISKC